MRRVLLILPTLLLVASAAYPCGGKYSGQNVRGLIRSGPAVRPASILILNNQSLRVYAESLKSTLKQLGHKVREVRSSEEALSALTSGKTYDIVMAEISDIDGLVEQLEATSSETVPLPLISGNSDEDLVQLEAFPFALTLSSKSAKVRMLIDRVLVSREES